MALPSSTQLYPALPCSVLCSALLLSPNLGRRSWAGSILVGGGKGGAAWCVPCGLVLEDYDPAFTSHSLTVTLTPELTTAQTDWWWQTRCEVPPVWSDVIITTTTSGLLSPPSHNWPRKSQIQLTGASGWALLSLRQNIWLWWWQTGGRAGDGDGVMWCGVVIVWCQSVSPGSLLPQDWAPAVQPRPVWRKGKSLVGIDGRTHTRTALYFYTLRCPHTCHVTRW